jgi:hypothetical protein
MPKSSTASVKVVRRVECCQRPGVYGVRHRRVAVGCEVFFQLSVGQDAGFLQAVHAFLDFKVDVPLGIEIVVGEVIFGNDFLGDVFAVNFHVLKDFHF